MRRAILFSTMTQLTPLTQRLGFQWMLSFLLWTLIGLIFFGQSYFFSYVAGQNFPVFSRLIFELTNAYAWALLSPVLFFLARRFPIEKPAVFSRIVLHVFLSIIVGLIHKLSSFWGSLVIAPPNNPLPPDAVVIKIIGGLVNSVIVYWILLGIYSAVSYANRFREQKLVATQLEAQLAQAQLAALKMQLQPHFLFNTLHAIATLMEEDIKAAQRMLTRLSELLRLTLDHVGEQEVPLSKEIEFLKSYLEIEEIRFHDRLRITYDIPPETLEAQVPTLILQPLVENAIRHGIAPKAAGGSVSITASRNGGTLQITIIDDGRGAAEIEQGVGLSNTRKRLEQLYGLNQTFEFGNVPDGGFTVALKLPFRTNNYEVPFKN